MPIRPENKKRYPKNWKDIRSKILARAASCEWCGARNYRPHPETGSRVVLTIAHVHDRSPENCAPDNLAALCQRCHNRHDGKERARTRNERRAKRHGGKMKAGEELDRLVAKKVMGWTCSTMWSSFRTGEKWRCENYGKFCDLDCPRFSEDIETAWEVAEKLKDLTVRNMFGDCSFTVKWNPYGEPCWTAGWMPEAGPGDQDLEFRADGDSAAHAICLAALRAVEEDV